MVFAWFLNDLKQKKIIISEILTEVNSFDFSKNLKWGFNLSSTSNFY